MKRGIRGFTLVEMLVVVSIIAVLVAILLPVFAAARKAGRKAVCASNLRQLLMAQKMYADDCDRTLVPARSAGYTWCVLLQPYMKNGGILVCPEDDKPQQTPNCNDLPHSYGINYNLTFNTSSRPFVFRMSGINRTTDLLLFFDMKSSAQAMGSSYYTSLLSRMDARHNDRCGVGFLDGHAKMLLPKATERPVNMWVP
jgi:prepilin-type N-terminal cleavage/methylation domain-containing protein/prepilin-type processing-associated H-X9-DG protein